MAKATKLITKAHNTLENYVEKATQLLTGAVNEDGEMTQTQKAIVELNAICAEIFKAMDAGFKVGVKIIGGEANQNRLGRDGSRYGS